MLGKVGQSAWLGIDEDKPNVSLKDLKDSVDVWVRHYGTKGSEAKDGE